MRRMSELGGRTFLVTGGNTGIGRATAAGLAERGGRVWITARSPAKGEAAVAGIKAETGSDSVGFLPLDLADLDSVRACASAFLALGEPLQVLVNNAGVGGARGLTNQGFEVSFGINHLGHFALTDALLGGLTASAPARVVTVASDAHYSAQGIDFGALRRPTRGITGLREYAVSKLCNVLFTQELARRVAGTVAGPPDRHQADAVHHRRRSDVLVLRHLAGCGCGQRAVLRQMRAAGAEPGGDARAGRGVVE